MELEHISLFTGIAGIDIAAEWAGFKTVCFVENNKYCQKVLRKHWPDVPIIEDVKDVTKEKIMAYADRMRKKRGQPENGEGQGIKQDCAVNRNSPSYRSNPVRQVSQGATTITRGICDDGCGITLISGGFPCQPHSVAGKREGSIDERNLWPEFRRVIGEIKPRWVMAENVPGIFSSDAGWFFGTILNDLAEMGYSTGWATYGAVDVGALHRRNRVFIVAYTGGKGQPIGESRRLREVSARRTYNPCPTPESNIVGYSRSGGLPGNNGGRSRQEFENGCVESRERSVANSNRSGWREQRGAEPIRKALNPIKHSNQDVADTAGRGNQSSSSRSDVRGFQGEVLREGWNPDYWATEPNVGRVAHGVPSRVDRLKCLGNAVVPQQIYPILQGIADIERQISFGE